MKWAVIQIAIISGCLGWGILSFGQDIPRMSPEQALVSERLTKLSLKDTDDLERLKIKLKAFDGLLAQARSANEKDPILLQRAALEFQIERYQKLNSQQAETSSSSELASASAELKRLTRSQYLDLPAQNLARYLYGMALVKANQLQQAERVLVDLLADEPDFKYAPAIALYLGEWSFNESKWSQAVKYYRLVAKAADSDYQTLGHYKLGWTWVNLSEPGQAFASWAQLLESQADPEFIRETLKDIGFVAGRVWQVPELLTWLTKQKLNPVSSDLVVIAFSGTYLRSPKVQVGGNEFKQLFGMLKTNPGRARWIEKALLVSAPKPLTVHEAELLKNWWQYRTPKLATHEALSATHEQQADWMYQQVVRIVKTNLGSQVKQTKGLSPLPLAILYFHFENFLKQTEFKARHADLAKLWLKVCTDAKNPDCFLRMETELKNIPDLDADLLINAKVQKLASFEAKQSSAQSLSPQYEQELKQFVMNTDVAQAAWAPAALKLTSHYISTEQWPLAQSLASRLMAAAPSEAAWVLLITAEAQLAKTEHLFKKPPLPLSAAAQNTQKELQKTYWLKKMASARSQKQWPDYGEALTQFLKATPSGDARYAVLKPALVDLYQAQLKKQVMDYLLAEPASVRAGVLASVSLVLARDLILSFRFAEANKLLTEASKEAGWIEIKCWLELNQFKPPKSPTQFFVQHCRQLLTSENLSHYQLLVLLLHPEELRQVLLKKKRLKVFEQNLLLWSYQWPEASWEPQLPREVRARLSAVLKPEPKLENWRLYKAYRSLAWPQAGANLDQITLLVERVRKLRLEVPASLTKHEGNERVLILKNLSQVEQRVAQVISGFAPPADMNEAERKGVSAALKEMSLEFSNQAQSFAVDADQITQELNRLRENQMRKWRAIDFKKWPWPRLPKSVRGAIDNQQWVEAWLWLELWQPLNMTLDEAESLRMALVLKLNSAPPVMSFVDARIQSTAEVPKLKAFWNAEFNKSQSELQAQPQDRSQ